MPAIGQILEVHQEVGNTYDRFAVATSRGGSTVGHLLIEFLKCHGIFYTMAVILSVKSLGIDRDLPC